MVSMPGPMQVRKIIVIHPGSFYLRVGRASDLNPTTILHAVGLRRIQPEEASGHWDALLPAVQQEAISELEEHRLQVSHYVQGFHQLDNDFHKRLRVATPPQQIATFNRRSVPEELYSQEEVFKEAKCNNEQASAENKEKIFDKDILSLTANDAVNYNIHFPIRRGELNLHSDIGGSLTSVLSEIEAIWVHAIEGCMGVDRSTLHQYSAVLVISDIYNRSHLQQLVSLLLLRLQFHSCFLVQDHVAATFGAGLGYACVIDVGDQKTSISCVEDGISHPDTRVRLGYGGGDITQVFKTLLSKCCFPYKECDVEADYADAALLTHLKEQFCHLNLNICGAQERTFIVEKTNKRLQYTLQLGDECIFAPLSFFYTELMNITGKQKQIRTQLPTSQQQESEDCFDAEYLRETGRRNGRDQVLEGVLPVTGEGAEDDLAVDADDVVERENTIRSYDRDELYLTSSGQILPLDLAIARSIERCSSEETKRKMFGSILLVGGSVKFRGFTRWVQQKIVHNLNSLDNHSSGIDVNVITKEMDPSMIAWKGAAIMSCLESAPELWILAGEWERYGLRILREKAPFIW